MSIDKVNARYDRQIYLSEIKNDFYNAELSRLSKRLFNLTVHFTMDDWQVIRTPKYWAKIDAINGDYEKRKYTIECVLYYLKHIKKA